MKEKQMKKVWIWIWVILIFIWLSALFFIWKQCGILIGEKIEALAIVTLVFATIFYAIQTQRLVAKQEKSIDEERRRREAEFADKKLQEFFSPMILELASLENNLKDLKTLAELVTSVKKLEKILIEMSRLMEKYIYLLHYEDAVAFAKVVRIHKKALLLKDNKEFKKWKADSISAIEKFTPGVQRPLKTLLIKVSEAFGVQDKKTIEELRSQLIEMAKIKNGNKEVNHGKIKKREKP